MGPRAGLDGRKNLVPTGIRSRTVQPGSSVGIATELPGLQIVDIHYRIVCLLVLNKFFFCTSSNASSKERKKCPAEWCFMDLRCTNTQVVFQFYRPSKPAQIQFSLLEQADVQSDVFELCCLHHHC